MEAARCREQVSETDGLEASPALNDLPSYSVLMSVYAGDRAAWFEQAIESMANQTLPPAEIVIMEDGPLPEALHDVVLCCAERHPGMIRWIALPENRGLAEAMRQGVVECKCEWIARMDSDDISEPRRCEEELSMAMEMAADVVGCDCDEFIDSVENPMSRRLFPEDHKALVRFSKRKVPFCHPAVMMKRSAVLRAGNYHNVFPHDDYDLFVRMLATGSVGYTVKKTLFHVRVNENFYRRRGGLQYVKTLVGFNLQLLKSGWTSPADFLVRSCGNILFGLSPVAVRTLLYRRLLRK